MKSMFKKVLSLIIVFVMMINLFPSFNIIDRSSSIAYAVTDNFTVPLSKDGKVIATYNKADKKLVISGNGQIEYDRFIFIS